MVGNLTTSRVDYLGLVVRKVSSTFALRPTPHPVSFSYEVDSGCTGNNPYVNVNTGSFETEAEGFDQMGVGLGASVEVILALGLSLDYKAKDAVAKINSVTSISYVKGRDRCTTVEVAVALQASHAFEFTAQVGLTWSEELDLPPLAIIDVMIFYHTQCCCQP
jgi:hypothetical protein